MPFKLIKLKLFPALWICSIFLIDYIKLTFNSTADLEFILKK